MLPQQLQPSAKESCKLRQKLQLHQYDDSGPVKSLIQNRVSLKFTAGINPVCAFSSCLPWQISTFFTDLQDDLVL